MHNPCTPTNASIKEPPTSSKMTITPLVLGGSSSGSSSSQVHLDVPSSVSIHPVALASILDHHLRRPRDSEGREQDRVIGTLMGTRKETGEIKVLSSFGVPFGEVEGKLLLDTDSLRAQLDIVVRAQPKLSVVGWYATHPDLNSWTPLIHDEYALLTASSTPATSALQTNTSPIHLTLDVRTLAVKAYASARLGLSVDTSSNRSFVPLLTEMALAQSEQSGLEVLTKHSVPTIRSSPASKNADTSTSSNNNATPQLVAPLVSLQGMLSEVAKMLDSILSYVKQVNEGSIQGDAKVGRYLLETLASVPMATSSRAQFEEDFNTHLADLLMVSYLANVVRVNLEVGARASMLHDARLAPRAA